MICRQACTKQSCTTPLLPSWKFRSLTRCLGNRKDMSEFFFEFVIFMFTCKPCFILLYEMNLHSESVLIHLPPSSSTSASPFWAICPSRSSLITGLVNAKFSGCALLRSNPQIICQTRKRYAITLNPEPNSVLNA